MSRHDASPDRIFCGSTILHAIANFILNRFDGRIGQYGKQGRNVKNFI
jgi:hypothetical protein